MVINQITHCTLTSCARDLSSKAVSNLLVAFLFESKVHLWRTPATAPREKCKSCLQAVATILIEWCYAAQLWIIISSAPTNLHRAMLLRLTCYAFLFRLSQSFFCDELTVILCGCNIILRQILFRFIFGQKQEIESTNSNWIIDSLQSTMPWPDDHHQSGTGVYRSFDDLIQLEQHVHNFRRSMIFH